MRLLLALLVSSSACFAADAAPAPVTATSGGATWSAVRIAVDSRMPAQPGYVVVDVLAEDIDLAKKVPKQSYAVVRLPTAVGEYPLGKDVTVTMMTPPSANKALSTGKISVTAADESHVEADISAKDASGATTISGHVSVTLAKH